MVTKMSVRFKLKGDFEGFIQMYLSASLSDFKTFKASPE